MSSSNQVQVSLVREATYGTTPTGNLTIQRFTAESLSGTPQTEESQEIRTDRQIADQIKTRTESGGALQIEFSAKTYDDHMEGAFYDGWQVDTPSAGTDRLVIGTDPTKSQFSIEKAYLDIANTFFSMVGQRVNEMVLNFQTGQILTGSFAFMGSDIDTPTSSIGTGYDPATTTDVLNAASDVGNVRIDNVATNIIIPQIQVNLNNNHRPKEGIGSDTPFDQTEGSCRITGNIQMHLDAASWTEYQKTISQTALSVDFQVSDSAGNVYTFYLPRIKLSGPTPQSPGLDQDVIVDAQFTALRPISGVISEMYVERQLS